MCKLKGYGKRCPSTPQRKESESFRQKVKYYARKEGMNSKEWLQTEKGHEFTKNNDPKILNPDWEKEHAESLKKLQGEPQVTMSNNFLAKNKSLDLTKSTFPTMEETRGLNPERDKYYYTGEDEYAEEVVKFNCRQDDELSAEEIGAIDTYTSSGKHESINNYLRGMSQGKAKDFPSYLHQVYGLNIPPKEGSEEWDRSVRIYGQQENDHLSTIKHLDSALSGRRKLESPEILYRGIKSELPIENLLEAYKSNTTITFDNYSSTSHSLITSLEFSNLNKMRYDKESKKSIFETHKTHSPPKGIPESNHDKKNRNTVIFEIQTNAGMSVANHTEYLHEKEILLPRGVHFKVVDSYAPNESNPYRLTRFSQNDECEIHDSAVIIQLVECDKDGNILGFDETEPIIPEPLEPAIPQYIEKMKNKNQSK